MIHLTKYNLITIVKQTSQVDPLKSGVSSLVTIKIVKNKRITRYILIAVVSYKTVWTRKNNLFKY